MVKKIVLVLFFVVFFAVPSMAQNADEPQKPVLTIYTYDAFAADWGPGPLLKIGFEKTCDCVLNWVATQSSISALRRAQLEGTTTKADIILGLDTSLLGEARATNLFIEHNVDTSSLIVPNNWRADDFVPFDYGYLAFVYNKERLPNPPKSFAELAERDDSFKIVLQDPRSATPGLGLVLWLKAAYGDGASEAWSQIAPNVITLTRSWSQSYALFLAGEADMVLSYTTSPAFHRIVENNDSFAAAPFREGHYTQIEVAGILASSKNQKLAQEFLTYLISPEAQTFIPTTNWMYPVADIKLPDGFETLFKPQNPLLLSDETIIKNAPVWIEEMLRAFQ